MKKLLFLLLGGVLFSLNLMATVTSADFSKYSTAADVTGTTAVENNGFYFLGNNSKATLNKNGFTTGGNSSSTARHIYFTPTKNGTLTVRGTASAVNTDRYIFVATAAGADETADNVIAKVAIPEKGTNHSFQAYLTAGTTYYICIHGNGTINQLSFDDTAKTKWKNPTITVGEWDAENKTYSVTIAGESGSSIKYSIDDVTYNNYSSAVSVAANATIYAYATGTGFSDSDKASKTMGDDPANLGSIKSVSGTTTTWDFTKMSQKQVNSMMTAEMGTWVDKSGYIGNPVVDAATYWSPEWCEGIQLGTNGSVNDNTKVRLYVNSSSNGFYLGGNAASVKVTVPAGANTLVLTATNIVVSNGIEYVNSGNTYTAIVNAGDEIEIHRGTTSGTGLLSVVTKYTAPINATIGSAGYSTFSAPMATTIPSGVTAYVVSVKDASTVTLTEIEDGVIPANTGVVLKGAAGTYSFVATATAGTATSILTPVLAETEVTADDYVLGNGSNGVGFYHLTAGKKVAANKAYLTLPAGAKFVGFYLDNDATAVDAVSEAKAESKAVKFIEGGKLYIKTANGVVNAAGAQVK